MVVVGSVTFFKAIAISVDLFGSEIVAEKHFKTIEDARHFKSDMEEQGLLCIVCQM